MAKPDLELLRLKEVLRLARERLTLIIQKVDDPAAIRGHTPGGARFVQGF